MPHCLSARARAERSQRGEYTVKNNVQAELLTEAPEKKKKFDYTWVVIVVCFLSTMVTLGFCSTPKNQYLDVVTKALDIPRSLFSLNDTFRHVATAVVNLFFGTLIAKFGAKKLMLAGMLSLCTAMTLFAVANNLFVFYLAATFMGIGFAWTGTSMVGRIISKWCQKNRGTIMGAVMAANGVGGAIATQILLPFIDNESGQHYRNAYMISACAVFAVGVLVLIFMREAPKNFDASKHVYTKKRGRGEPWVGIDFEEVKRSPYFYAILVCIFLTGFCLQGISGVSKAHMKDVGLDPTYIKNLISIGSLCLTMFKFLSGFLYDRFGLRFSATMCATGSTVATLLLAFLSDTPSGEVMAAVYKVLSAMALPLETVMIPIYAADLFGERSYDKVLGLFVSVNVTGFALGAPFFNLCFDISHTYKYVLIFGACVMFCLVIALQFIISAAHRTRDKVLAELASNPS